jgi:putative nucleotidyltransferase with HDIG domain
MGLHIAPLLKEIASVFTGRGKEVFLVGGAVRDMLLGKNAHDWDLATSALPEEVIAMFHAAGCSVIPTGIKHGTVTVRYKGHFLEVTTFRTESDYLDGRRPEQVDYTASIEEDLSRRDFTMNAIALQLPEGRVVDPFGGREDIKARRIRCVGDPLERFSEDGLRPLRAVRFASQLGFLMEDAVLAAILPSLSITAKVAPERVRDELGKIIASDRPSTALLLMERTGLLGLVLPELAACRGIDQKGFHRFDVLNHSLLACDFAARQGYDEEVRLAALFHDLGKVATRRMDDSGVWTFYGHEQVSVDLCRDIMRRFRYSNAVRDTVLHLIGEHMFHYEDIWTSAAVRRFIIRVGREYLDRLYQLRMADSFGLAGIEPSPELLVPLISRVDAVLAEERALSLKDLCINGADLLALGEKPGPRIGIILKELFEAVLDDPALNNRDRLLSIATTALSGSPPGPLPRAVTADPA